MNKLEEIFAEGKSLSEKIEALKERNADIPYWETIKKDYEPELHRIKDDHIGRKDKIRKDQEGRIVAHDKAARITIGLEQLHVNRIAEFMFALPVKRVYHNVDDNLTRAEIGKIIELIYKYARFDSENIKRAISYFASCEIFTLWYAVKKRNNIYGFSSDYKLKCKTMSPMNGYSLYPLFDEYGDLLAMSYEYKITIAGNSEITYFETFTANKHYVWKKNSNSEWVEVSIEDVVIMKIPGVYGFREKPIFHGLSGIREEIEYTLSRNSDVVAYNSAPVLKIVGEIAGSEDKGEGQRIFRVENGGDVAYVSWSQAIEALKFQVDTMKNLYWTQAQMPDISFEKMSSLGNIGYDARMTLLTDSYLKIGEESGVWIELLERECNVIKAFLAMIRKDLASEIDNVEIDHVITPYVQNDEQATIERLLKANGGKPLMSHLDSIRHLNYSYDPEKTLSQIQKEEEAQNEARINDLFSEGAM